MLSLLHPQPSKLRKHLQLEEAEEDHLFLQRRRQNVQQQRQTSPLVKVVAVPRDPRNPQRRSNLCSSS